MTRTYLAWVVLTLLAPWPARAAPPSGFPASTHVVAVPDPEHILVAHGKKDRFPANAKGLRVSPRPPPRPDRDNPPVEFGVVIALADVERVDDETALLRLYEVKEAPKAGDHVGWSLVVPKEHERLKDQVLFWAAVLDIGARDLEMTRNFFSLRDFFAAKDTEAKALEAMVDEVHANAALADEVWPDALDRGDYRGRKLSEIFRNTTQAELVRFWDSVLADPWSYITWSYRLVDIYATWLVRGAPAGTPVKTQRVLVLAKLELGQVMRRHEWEAAERRLIELLRMSPGDAGLAAELEAVIAIRRSDAALERDPNDDAAAWIRARALAAIGHYPAAIRAFEALIGRDYRTDDAKLQLGYALCGAARWADCEAHFDAMIRARSKRSAPDANLEKWRAFARTRGTQGGNNPAADALSHIATARALEDESGWSNALASWRNAVTLARGEGDGNVLRVAETGLARALKRVALIAEVEAGVAALKTHDVERAAKALAAVREAARAMGEPDAGVIELGALAAAAYEVGERAFGRIVFEARLEDVPEASTGAASIARGGSLADLAERVAEDADLARAEMLFSEAVKRAPENIEARAKRAWFFAEGGRWADAYSASFMNAAKSVAMTWAMVRATVARKQLDEALDYSARLGRRAPALGLVDAAVHRLVAVERELPAAPVGSEARARLLLRRIRALCEIGLERIALDEIRELVAFPELQREAAWAIARPPSPPRVGVDLLPWSARLEAATIATSGAPIPERVRRLALLTDRSAKALLAEGLFHEAWALARRSEASEIVKLAGVAIRGLEADTLLGHARAARERGDHPQQEALAAKAHTLYAAIGVVAGTLDALLLDGEALHALGRRDTALAVLGEGLALAEKDGNPERTRAFEALLARIRSTDGKGGGLDRLELTLRTHLGQCLALDDDRCRAKTLEDLALVALQRGGVTEARRSLDDAAASYRSLHDGRGERRAAMAIARVHRLRSELAQAAAKAEEVLAAAIEDSDGVAERQALLELGSLALAGGDLIAARKWLASATEAAVRGNDEVARARAEATLGRAELLLGGDLAVSIAAFERAMKRFEKSGTPGDSLEARIDLAEALIRASKSPDRNTKKAASRAIDLLAGAPKRAAALGRDVLQIDALLALASARLETRAADVALAVLDEVQPLVERVELADLRARADHLRARVYLLAGRRDAAAEIALQAAHRLAEPLSRGSLPLGRAGTQAVFQQGADLLFELGRHEDALELLELQRTASEVRTFDLEQLRRSAHPTLAADLGQYADARARGDAIEARLREDADDPDAGVVRDELIKLAAASHAELKPLAERLMRDHPDHWKALARDPTSLATERKKLPKGTTLVEYFVTGEALYLFVVRPGKVSALRVDVPADELAEAVTRYRKLVMTDARLAEPLGRELFGWLLAPVAELVPAAERAAATIMLLPQGPLYEVPFQALVASRPDEPLRYAIEDWRLAVASASTLAPLLAGPRKLAVLGPVLGLADPDGSLPEARKELDSLPEAIRRTILRGADATEERLLTLSSDHRILHFATHGTLAKNPLDSALVLASGRLTVERIAGLETLRGKVALVFLSACQSGTEVAGDALAHETMSLAEGFAMAGVPTMIAALWDVDDRATRVLVEAFYRQLVAKRLDTLGALREAQLATIATVVDGQRPFADPRYWSAFQLIGDFR